MITQLELLYIKKLHKDKDDIKTLANKIGVNQSLLYDIESGRRSLSVDLFNKILTYYGANYDDSEKLSKEAYDLVLELFSYIIAFEKPNLYKRYDEIKERLEIYKHSKAFIYVDLIEALNDRDNDDQNIIKHLEEASNYLDNYDNNIIFIYAILWAFSKQIDEDIELLEEIILKNYERYSLIGVRDDVVAMLYYQIGRIYEAKQQYFEALDAFDKAIAAFQNINNLQRTIQVKIQKANCYFVLKDYAKAENEYKLLYEESLKYNFRRREIACLNNLAFLYFYLHDYDNALKYVDLAKTSGSTFSSLNYYKAYIIYKNEEASISRKEIKQLISDESDITTLRILKLIHSFLNENDKNIDYYLELIIKDLEETSSYTDEQLIYEMVLDYYKDKDLNKIYDLLPNYIKLIRK